MALFQGNVMEAHRSGGAMCSFEMKTDLKLLLECLKFQMDNPELQKETLVAIRSICQNNSEVCDYFREIGGLLFIVSLAKCVAHPTLKEITFYTLGVLAESNVFCQQTLCTAEMFEDVSVVLSEERSSVSLKRTSVFLLLVLISNNKAGQVLVRESGCIDLLLLLFSSTAPSMLPRVEIGDPRYQLWLSVCSALSACVNNPQNEENQKLCSSAFPRADKWLQHSVQPEVVRPVCSLIGLSVANNRFSQDCFVSIGGLDTLANVLLQLVTNVQTRGMDCALAVVVSKTLDACVAENSGAVHRLSQYGIVSSLITLLAHRGLDPEDRFSIVLTLGHCTEDCEPNQYELLRGNGLPLVIQILTESQDDETHKAATFVLQNCRHTTEMLSLNLNEQTPNAWKIPENRHDEFWEKAKEIYRKIEYLQQQHNEDIANMEEPEANAVLPFIYSHSKQQRHDPSLTGSNPRLLEKRNDPSLTGSNPRLLEKRNDPSLTGSNPRLLEKRNDPSLTGSNPRLLEKRNDPSLTGSNPRLLEKRNDPSLTGSNPRLLEKRNDPSLTGSNQREQRNDPSLTGSNPRLLEKRNDPSLTGSNQREQRNDPSLTGSNERLLEQRNDPSLTGSNQRSLEKRNDPSLTGSNQRLLEKRNDPSLTGSNPRLLGQRNDPSLTGSNQRLLGQRNDPSLTGSNPRLLGQRNDPSLTGSNQRLLGQRNDPSLTGSNQRLLEKRNDPSLTGSNPRLLEKRNDPSLTGSNQRLLEKRNDPSLTGSNPRLLEKRNDPSLTGSNQRLLESNKPAEKLQNSPSCAGPMCRERSCESSTQTTEHHMTDPFLQPHTEHVQDGEPANPHSHSPSNSRTDAAGTSPPIRRAVTLDPMSLCADIISEEISSALGSRISQTRLRCSGCLVTGLSMNSRNCSKILQKCPHLCDNHRIVLQTEDRYKAELRKLLSATRIYPPHTSLSLTPLRTGRQEAGLSHLKERLPHGFLLTPIRKSLEEERDPAHAERFPQLRNSDINAEHPRGSPGEIQEVIDNEIRQGENLGNANPRRARRKDFTGKEMADLLDGVRKFGHHWNAILWSYPFQEGRRNVDLAKKYKQLRTCDNTDQ
ncbi:telomere repeats-binding bouquet formation protein 1 isoform X2 [Rana temporaria]|uniref:telomere repeats-binding bouquet formation protein 1 isoform X2 n=1 Tax=Rana temporaria TaxID=8407 RepID=UPI001AAD30C4|nr:telomere repeats-binding bouquet formation protein 1 isoform X2 [Rana temporaria]